MNHSLLQIREKIDKCLDGESRQCLAHREETPQIESVSADSDLLKFTPEQSPEHDAQLCTAEK